MEKNRSSKIIAVVVYMISLFVVNNFWGLGAMLVLSLAIVLISRIPLRFFFRGIKAIVFIVLLTVILQMFMTPGEPLVELGFLKITKEGCILSLQGILDSRSFCISGRKEIRIPYRGCNGNYRLF